MNITSGLRRALQIKKHGLAIVCQDRARSWDELGARVARLAGGLLSLGLVAGDRIALLAQNSDRYFEMYLATAWAGLVIVPLNTRWTSVENTDALVDSGASLLVVDRTFVDTVRFARKLLLDDTAPDDLIAYEALLARSAPVPDAMCGADDLAGIFYTGGTTGRSRGVMLSHGNLMQNAMHFLGEGLYPSTSVYLNAAPMFHLANGAGMFATMLSAATNVVLPTFTPHGFFEQVQAHGVTDTILVPTMLQLVADHPDRGKYDLSSLQMIMYGASPLSESVLDRAQVAFPGVDLVQAYGMTELSPVVTVLHAREHTEGRKHGRHRSAGRATIGVEVLIIDEHGTEVPRGTVGEVIVRGDILMLGYWQRPEETAKVVRDGWMRTGDGGWMDDDGFVYLVDRIKDMIISGGENVYSIEVENVVARHPAVAQCAVIGIPSEQWGETVHVVVVLKPSAALEPGELLAFCKAEQLSGYRCPRSVEVRASLPLSGAGKILKRELRDSYQKGL